MSTGVVILAAGQSVRMGGIKQLLAFRGTTLLQHAIATAQSLSGARVVVVLGAHAAQIRARLDDPRLLVAENAGWRDGMAGSIRSGLEALLAAHPDTSAAIILLGDQPLLSPADLKTLVAAHERSGSPIVASEYDGVLGVPALFARALFPKLLALSGAEGARQIIRAHREQAIAVPCRAGATDIDTPADYTRLCHYHQPLIPV